MTALEPGGRLPVPALATLLALLPALPLTAPPSLAAAPAPSRLESTAWVVVRLGERPPLGGSTLTLRFDGGRVAGSDGCNRFGAPVTIQGTRLQVSSRITVTKMACAPAVLQQGEAFRSALASSRGFRMADDRLQLLAAGGRPLLVLVPQSQQLAGREWRVAGFNNGRQALVSPILGTTLSLRFQDGGRLVGSAGCNRFTARVQVTGSRISIATPVPTRNQCPGAGVMEQERQFLAALPTATSLRLEGESAELRRADGAIVLSLRRVSTP